MKTPADIRDIAKTRLNESKALVSAALYDGAFYLAGYSVELALKAKICDTLDIPNLFDESFRSGGAGEIQRIFKIHKLDDLMLLSGNRRNFEQAKASNPALHANWMIIAEKWNEHCRYMCCNTKSQLDAQELIEAIGDNKNGVLTWILNN